MKIHQIFYFIYEWGIMRYSSCDCLNDYYFIDTIQSTYRVNFVDRVLCEYSH